ncbi:MAG: hypothetical protein C0168_05285 [Candidatus Aminicenantes bacterium]|nr:MAG: hypothetical protein C0168_05285 [Candidatus Aminicenantes bacterium]
MVKYRRFVSLGLLISFISLLLVGLVLFFRPEADQPGALSWKFLGLEREAWGETHKVLALIFVFLTINHIFLNLDKIKEYLKN